MLDWLQTKLRSWLLAGDLPEKSKTSPFLDCVISTPKGVQEIKVEVVGSAGLMLIGNRPAGGGCRLIAEREATDRDQFRELWAHYNAGAVLEWESNDDSN